MWGYVKGRAQLFYQEMLSSAGIWAAFAVFIILKLVVNLQYGAGALVAVRSGVLGSIFYLFGYYVICLFAVDDSKIPKENVEVPGEHPKKVLLIALAFALFIFLRIVDDLQGAGYISGTPILSFIPGYHLLMQFIDTQIAAPIASLADFILPKQVGQIIKGGIFYVLIPFLIFRKLGYTFKGRVFSMKNSRAAWPIIGIYVIQILLQGFRVEGLWYIAYAFLHPALQEEFFDRGILLPIFSRFFKKMGNMLAAGTLIFALMHFPDLYFRVSEGNLLMALGSMSSVMLTGLLYAYGYRKTGSLLPMMIIHALEDALFMF